MARIPFPIRPPYPRHGFTLIELLIVISIIALLIAVLLPALAASRRSAQAVVCATRLRQITTAALTFAHDHDGMLPSAGSLSFGPPGQNDIHASWFFSLDRYLTGDMSQTARCIADESPYWDAPEPATQLKRAVSYATNYYLSGWLTGYEDYAVLTGVPRPSNTVYLTELAEQGSYATSDHVHPELWWIDPTNEPRQQIALNRHNQQPNWGYLDGHVASRPLDEVYLLAPDSTVGKLIWTVNHFDPIIAR